MGCVWNPLPPGRQLSDGCGTRAGRCVTRDSLHSLSSFRLIERFLERCSKLLKDIFQLRARTFPECFFSRCCSNGWKFLSKFSVDSWRSVLSHCFSCKHKITWFYLISPRCGEILQIENILKLRNRFYKRRKFLLVVKKVYVHIFLQVESYLKVSNFATLRIYIYYKRKKFSFS